MSERPEGGRLQAGVLTLNRRLYLGPSSQEYRLFEEDAAYDTSGINYEKRAVAMLGTYGIITSAHCALRPIDATPGYLLRLVHGIHRFNDLEERGITTYTTEEMTKYTQDLPEGVQKHFLAQVVREMV